MFKLFRKEPPQKKSLTSADLFDMLIDSGSASTINNLAAVQLVRKILCQSVGQLPLKMTEELPGGGSKPAKSHSLYSVFHDAVDENTTPASFFQGIVGNLFDTGHHFSYINKISSGKILELNPLPPTCVEVKLNASGEKYFVYTPENGEQRIYQKNEVLHIRAYGGHSFIQEVKHAAELGVSLEKYSRQMADNGIRPGGVFELPGVWDEEKTIEFAKKMKKQAGGDNAGKSLVLDAGVTWKQVAMSAEDAEILSSRKFQKVEIISAARIPLHMAGDLEHATFSNIEHQDLAFVKYCLMGLTTPIEQEFKLQLLDRKERSKYSFKFSFDSLLRGDATSRGDFLQKMVMHGIYTLNEARAKENQNPVKGGDVHFVPVNLQSLDNAITPLTDDDKLKAKLLIRSDKEIEKFEH